MAAAGAVAGRGEAGLALALAAAAAVRVALLAAAFPFFTNVDEHRHVDAVLKYARGTLPRPGTSAYEPRMGTLLGLYGSPEYHLAPGRRPPEPPWRGPRGRLIPRIEAQEAFLAPRHNLEAFESPVYYAVAAVWLKLGSALGARGAALLYWVRMLGAVGTGLLAFAAWRLLRDAYPGNRFVRLGVPLLLAVFPQDALYYVNRDALSPLVAGLAFLLIARLARRPDGSAWVYAAAGGLAGAAFLVKYTNAPVLAAGALCTAVWLGGPGRDAGTAGKLALGWAAALLPVGLWLARNQWLFGEWLGSGFKIERMGWGVRAPSELLDHPLFSARGLAVFVGDLIPTFWRGQLAWHRLTLAHVGVDRFYTLSTLLLLACAVAGLLRRDPRAARREEALALLCVGLSALLLAGLSLVFRFHETSDPSAEHPYFTHGRLVSGALVPFLVVYLRGIQVATGRLGAAGPRLAWLCLAGVVAAVTVSEAALSRDVFRSAWNWYHLP